MKLRWLLPGVLIGWQIGAGAEETNAPVSAAEIESLRQQVQALERKVGELERRQGGDTGSNGVQQLQELDQKIRIVQRQRELDQENADAAAKSVSRLSIGADGFKASSADTNFVLVIHGLVQVDSRTFPDDGGIRGNDGFILRRARPIIQGTVFRNFDFVFVPDFGGNTVQVQDAFVNYRYRPELQLQAGKFKSPVGLEALQPDPAAAFNERSLVTDLVPNRDLGFELHGDLFGGAASYAIGIFNGAPDYSGTTTNSDFEDDKALAARIFLQPWKASDVAALQGLGFGVGGSWEVVDGATNTVGTGLTPGFTTDGQEKFFSYSSGVYAHGTHWRVSPQACYYYGPIGLMGEYVISDQRVSKGSANTDLQNVAWEVTAL
ncbi:MAG TPA: porin, partial [Verrucomicrobiae bacterium]|nr:porin [Verrucomicrobiae bacterium]